jgi:putative ABC transport system permease protein
MRPTALAARNLRAFWKTGLLVTLGVALATAVLTGALVVGDSVTGSLRATALARLGDTTHLLVAPHWFPASLAERLAAQSPPTTRVAPLLLTRGALTALTDNAVVPDVTVLGVTTAFWRLYPQRMPAGVEGRGVALNQTLAAELHVAPGESLILTVAREGESPAALFLHRDRSHAFWTLRVRVAAIVPDAGPGGFALHASSLPPRTLLIDQRWLAMQLDQRGQANALAVAMPAHGRDAALTQALQATCRLADYGLTLQEDPAAHDVALQSIRVLLPPAVVAKLPLVAERAKVPGGPTSFYFATRITNTSVKANPPAIASYALLGATHSSEALLAGARVVPGTPAMSYNRVEPPARDGIWLTDWLATDVQARVGDRLRIEYLIPTRDGQFRESSRLLHVQRILSLPPEGHPTFVPALTGITGATRIDEWDPPFPIDLTRVTPRDDAFWARYQTTPKAYINLETARELWQQGPDGATAAWVGNLHFRRGDLGAGPLGARVTAALLRTLTPPDVGMTLIPVRAHAVAAAKGTTDFAGLFLGMSIFILGAALCLAGAQMRLLIDRRADEMGLLLALGVPPPRILAILWVEAGTLVGLGAVLGSLLGVAYAAGILQALTTWWLGAVGTRAIWLHVVPDRILTGAALGLLAGAAAVGWGMRHLLRQAPLTLLAGWRALAARPQWGLSPRRRIVAWGALLGALLLLGCGLGGCLAPAGAFFGGGALVLLAGVLGAARLLGGAQAMGVRPTVPALARRFAACGGGRSLLVVGLLASATFVVVTVAGQHRQLSWRTVAHRTGGAGGFAVRAIATAPLPADLSSVRGRAQLGLMPEEERQLDGLQTLPFLMQPGQEISCLNLTRTQAPRVLGVLPEMIARGGFTIQTAAPAPDGNPWRLLDTPVGPDGVIPAFGDAESVRWSLHADLGQTITIPDSTGRPVRVRFVGLIASSIFAGELLVSAPNFSRLYPGISVPRYFLLELPQARIASSLSIWRRTFGEVGVDVRTTRQVLNTLLSVQNAYLATFLALGGLGLLLGTLGLVVALVRSAIERRRDFALMGALGIPPRTQVALLVWEHAGLLVLGILLGTLAALLAVAPHLASGEAPVNWRAVGGMLCAVLGWGGLTTWMTARLAVGEGGVEALRQEE